MTEDEPKSRAQIIASIAGTMGHERYPNGSLAALKRAPLSSGGKTEAMRLLIKAGASEAQIMSPRWHRLAHLMALLAAPGRSPHSQGVTNGAQLVEASYSSMRLERLLQARNGTQDRLIEGLFRLMASKMMTLNIVPLAPLILDEDQDWVERTREKLMREFIQNEV